ncbi:MAG: ribonuclease HII [Candidatus Scatomorpha sp.]
MVGELYRFDENFIELKSGFVAGVDEAGRGPLAGDVFAAAVILDRDCMIEGLDDSKKLSFKKREELFEKIINNSLAYGIATASVAEIDRLNILEATVLAMNRAIKLLKVNPDFALIDGNYSKGIVCDNIAVIGGDRKSASIAAASILAKVSRDRYMLEIADKYPVYNFSKHKGYGTKEHIEAIKKYGVCKLHREKFCRKFI